VHVGWFESDKLVRRRFKNFVSVNGTKNDVVSVVYSSTGEIPVSVTINRKYNITEVMLPFGTPIMMLSAAYEALKLVNPVYVDIQVENADPWFIRALVKMFDWILSNGR